MRPRCGRDAAEIRPRYARCACLVRGPVQPASVDRLAPPLCGGEGVASSSTRASLKLRRDGGLERLADCALGTLRRLLELADEVGEKLVEGRRRGSPAMGGISDLSLSDLRAISARSTRDLLAISARSPAYLARSGAYLAGGALGARVPSTVAEGATRRR